MVRMMERSASAGMTYSEDQQPCGSVMIRGWYT